MAVVVIRYENKATARLALTFIVRIFVNDTIAITVWTSFYHVVALRPLPAPAHPRYGLAELLAGSHARLLVHRHRVPLRTHKPTTVLSETFHVLAVGLAALAAFAGRS